MNEEYFLNLLFCYTFTIKHLEYNNRRYLFKHKFNHSVKSLMKCTPVAKKLQLLKEKLSQTTCE